MAKQGKFIVLEGLDGAGKTTIAKYLAQQFGDKILTHHASSANFSKDILSLLVSKESQDAGAPTQFFLAWAAHAYRIKFFIKPSILKGVNVVSDRFDASTYAYQVAGPEAEDLADLFFKTRRKLLKDCKPDLYIFLDIKPGVGLRRLKKHNIVLDYFEKKKINFHEKARSGYLKFLKKFPHRIVDANRSLNEVKTDVQEVVKELFK